MQYVKIKEAIVEQIDSGMLVAKQKLPAERKFADMFDTTRVTLREALSLLEVEGKIYREDRRGWFISPEPLRYDPAKNLCFSNMAKAQERVPSTAIFSAKLMLAPKQVSILLKLPPFTDVYCIERVHSLEERPIAYVKSYVREASFPNLLDVDLSLSLTDIYREHYDVSYQKTHYKVKLSSLVGDVAQTLRTTSCAPAILIERANYDQHNQLISCDIEYWRHDAIHIESTLKLD